MNCCALAFSAFFGVFLIMLVIMMCAGHSRPLSIKSGQSSSSMPTINSAFRAGDEGFGLGALSPSRVCKCVCEGARARDDEPKDRKRPVGTIRLETGRVLRLTAQPHPTRRHRYLYEAQTIDMQSPLELQVLSEGYNISLERDLGSDELQTGASVTIPELGLSGVVWISYLL